jgi:hypothetical protein
MYAKIRKGIGKMFKSRKGEDALVDFVAIIVFVVILLLFLIIFWATKRETNNNIEADFMDKNSAFMLNAFLRAPSLTYTDKTVGEVIAQDYLKNNYDDSKSMFEGFFKNINKYNNRLINYIDICFEKNGKDVGGFRYTLEGYNQVSTWSSCNKESTSAEKNNPGVSVAHSAIPAPDGSTLNIRINVRYDWQAQDIDTGGVGI